MAFYGGQAINATLLPLQNRYGLSRRKSGQCNSFGPGPRLVAAARSAIGECPCIINCGRVMPGALQSHVVIGASVLVNESFKRRACIPVSVNLG